MSEERSYETLRDRIADFSKRAQKDPENDDLWSEAQSLRRDIQDLTRELHRQINAATSHLDKLEEKYRTAEYLAEALGEFCVAFGVKKPRRPRR